MNEASDPSNAASSQADPTCPWCAEPVIGDETHCRSCGAAVAQRESIAGVKIPGLTSVDPALEDFDKRPLHLRGPSPSQGMAPALIVGAMAGGPIGLMAVGGVAALAAAEFMGAQRQGADGTPREDVGRPSEVLLQALERADADAANAEAGAAEADAEPAASEPEPDHASDEGGRSIWRDLPPSAKGPADEGEPPSCDSQQRY